MRTSFVTIPGARRALLATLVGATSALLGCGEAQPGDDERLGTATQALFANDQTSFDYFVAKGLTGVQAAGIVGNLDQESGDSPTAVQSGGPGRGVAQWSVGGRWDTSAGDNENAYVGAANIWNLNSQLGFIWYELTTFPAYGLADLKSQTTVAGATNSFMTLFEICGTCDATTRASYAQAVYAAYGTTPSYGASFVAQSFPFATTTLMMTEGQVIASYIELKNTGSKTWDSNTKIGTTQPRDRASVFADGTWLAPNRPAAVTGTVPPGGTYKFTFNLAAPMKAGSYDEFFGVLEEGVAWFSDSGEGGPPDNQLEVKIQVVAGASSSSSSGGSTTSSSGGSTSSSGSASGSTSSGSSGESSTSSSGSSGAGGAGTGGSGAGAASTSSGTVVSGASSSSGASTSGVAGLPGESSGCAASPSAPAGRSEPLAFGLMLAAAGLARRRRARRAAR
jgi:hypothetical protein